MANSSTGPHQGPDRHSEERVQLAVDAAGMGLWDWDIATGEVVWSHQCRVLYGLPADADITYERFLQALHPEDRDRVDAALRQAASGGGIYHQEKRVVWPDGSVHWTDSRAQVFCDEAGRPLRMIGVTFDITERKLADAALRAREAELRLIVDHVPGMIAYADTAYRIRFANRAFVEFYAKGEANVEGETLGQVLEPANGVHALPRMACSLTGETQHYESKQRRRDGATRTVDVTLVPNLGENGKVCGVFTFIIDVTERLEAEQGRLERARLEAANQELNAFAYAAAHDLNAPLRAISAFVGMLRESDGDRLSKEGDRALGRIEACTHHLQELITALLQYARSARSQLQVTQLDLAELVREALDILRHQYPTARVQVGPLPRVRGDRALLWDVLVNLIGNALKFSSKRDSPLVEIGTVATSRGEAVFVRDNGVGFSPAQADKLFQVFSRLHEQSQFPGTGIGLAYTRRVLRRHGSEIWAESQPDEGATFYFALPFPLEAREVA